MFLMSNFITQRLYMFYDSGYPAVKSIALIPFANRISKYPRKDSRENRLSFFLCRQPEGSAHAETRRENREELTTENEENKKKIRQFDNREKVFRRKRSVKEHKARNHWLCGRSVIHTKILFFSHVPPSFSGRATLKNSVELYRKTCDAFF